MQRTHDNSQHVHFKDTFGDLGNILLSYHVNDIIFLT